MKAYKIALVLSVRVQMVLLHFEAGLLRRKINIKFMLASLKALTNS
jgi:hypothetical protein